jgi:hypothetical protein
MPAIAEHSLFKLRHRARLCLPDFAVVARNIQSSLISGPPATLRFGPRVCAPHHLALIGLGWRYGVAMSELDPAAAASLAMRSLSVVVVCPTVV